METYGCLELLKTNSKFFRKVDSKKLVLEIAPSHVINKTQETYLKNANEEFSELPYLYFEIKYLKFI